jgi:PPIC-type PPIASE domain
MENKRLKNIIRIIGVLVVALLMAIPCWSGNNPEDTSQYEDSRSGKTETKKSPETRKVESTNKTSNREVDLSSRTLILTVGSSPVCWPEFHFWLNFIQKYYRSYHNIDRITDWSAKQNGMSLKEFFLSNAVAYACKDRAIEAKARELGIELSVRDLAEIEKLRNDNIKIYGSELEYIRIVSSMYVSEDVFTYLTKIDYLGNYLFEKLYGAKGEKCSDKDISEYIREEGLMCSKYIFLPCADSAGKEVSAETLAGNYKLLEDILGRLDKSADPLGLFDTLMTEYGKDRSISSYPDGRLFVSGAMEQEFESSYLKLGENKYSRIVKTGKGYYIILRKPIFPDMTADSSGNTLRYRTAYDHLFKNQIENLSSKMDIKYEDAYYRIDPEKLQDN